MVTFVAMPIVGILTYGLVLLMSPSKPSAHAVERPKALRQGVGRQQVEGRRKGIVPF